MRAIVLSLAATLVFTTFAPAQEEEKKSDPRAEYVRANYTKYEFRVPMRDGVKLFTAVYTPNDTSGDTPKSYPFILLRTPYSVAPYGLSEYKDRLASEALEKEGFIFVFQDVRGRWMSEGEFRNMTPHVAEKTSKDDVDESTDTYDTIEWLLENVPGNNGKVGQWGNSYPGFYTAAGMIDSHPALKASIPQAPIADWFFDDFHRHGAFVLPMAFQFFSRFGIARPEPIDEWPEAIARRDTPDGYQFYLDVGPLANVNKEYFEGEIDFWNQLAAHPNYDEFWQSRNILPHLKNITSAVMVVGGWFDTEDLYGPLNIYREVERNNPGTTNVLMMGPWCHGCWRRTDGRRLGTADFGFETSELFQELELAFYLHHLKDGEAPNLSEAMVFETGANRWRRFDAWPPAAARSKTLYFQPGQGLTFDTPPLADGFDEYLSDPAKPVPSSASISGGWTTEYMTEDQRFAAWRPDVLVYATEPLDDDVTLAGPLVADLWVSTTASAADWVVKLVDAFPPSTLSRAEREDPHTAEEDRGNHQMLVRAAPIRGRFRNSYETPEPFVPGEVTRVRFKINDVFHTFQRGHRIMIQVQSSWFPFIDRNPQTYVENIFEAREEDFVKATHRVYRSPEHPSGVQVQVLE